MGRVENYFSMLPFKRLLSGTLETALLFYQKLVSKLKVCWFVVNPYYPFVATKTVNGKQLTVTWNVDDFKISCVSSEDVSEVIEWFKRMYGHVWIFVAIILTIWVWT